MNRSARAALTLVVGASLLAPATGTASAGSVLTLSQLRESARTWREGGRLATFAAQGMPVGTTFSFTLSRPATVLLSFAEPGAGRTVGGKCVPRTTANRMRAKCSPIAGTVAHAAHAGVNTVAFEGRLSPRRRLAPRSYRLIISAADTSGHTSAPRTLGFTIVRG